jgi:CCR4-NOT transcription complex subunit 2
MFSSSSRLSSNQGSFRFGNQPSSAQASQPPSGGVDEFPPLNNNGGFRNGTGEIGQERGGSNLMSQLGFGAQTSSASALPGTRAGNGLLNALSANTRTTDVRSPDASAPGEMGLFSAGSGVRNHDGLAGSSRPQDLRSAIGADEPRQKPPGFREESVASPSSVQEAPTESEAPSTLGAIGNDVSGKARDDTDGQSPAVHDPLAGMAPIDRWGIKGLRTLMNNFPDYSSAVTGVDPNHLGLNLTSSE